MMRRRCFNLYFVVPVQVLPVPGKVYVGCASAFQTADKTEGEVTTVRYDKLNL